MEVLLHPGEFYFGDADTRIRTLLGSCVAITVWHPSERIGGMCHYMLPTRHRRTAGEPLNGKYADEAVAWLLEQMAGAGTTPFDYQIKMFGGGRQFVDTVSAAAIDVPERNVQVGLDLLAASGLALTARHLGGTGHRQVILDIATGDVWLSHVDRAAPELIP